MRLPGIRHFAATGNIVRGRFRRRRPGSRSAVGQIVKRASSPQFSMPATTSAQTPAWDSTVRVYRTLRCVVAVLDLIVIGFGSFVAIVALGIVALFAAYRLQARQTGGLPFPITPGIGSVGWEREILDWLRLRRPCFEKSAIYRFTRTTRACFSTTAGWTKGGRIMSPPGIDEMFG